VGDLQQQQGGYLGQSRPGPHTAQGRRTCRRIVRQSRPGRRHPDWNIYQPRWARTAVARFPTAANRSLQLEDRDPYDYAKAVRVFAEAVSARVAFKVLARQTDAGRLEVEVSTTRPRPVRIVFGSEGRVQAADGSGMVDAGSYRAGSWYRVEIAVSAAGRRYDVSLNGGWPSDRPPSPNPRPAWNGFRSVPASTAPSRPVRRTGTPAPTCRAATTPPAGRILRGRRLDPVAGSNRDSRLKAIAIQVEVTRATAGNAGPAPFPVS